MTRSILMRVILMALLVVLPVSESLAGVVVSFTAPTANTAYAVGATITYSGTASWPVNNFAPPVEVVIYLRHNNAKSGPIIDSETATWTVKNVTTGFGS